MQPYPMDRLRDAAGVILVLDGSQVLGDPRDTRGSAAATAYRIDDTAMWRAPFLLRDSVLSLSASIHGGRNVNAELFVDDDAGRLRWRHHGDTTGNVVHADGHAASHAYGGVHQTGVLKRMVYLPRP